MNGFISNFIANFQYYPAASQRAGFLCIGQILSDANNETIAEMADSDLFHALIQLHEFDSASAAVALFRICSKPPDLIAPLAEPLMRCLFSGLRDLDIYPPPVYFHLQGLHCLFLTHRIAVKLFWQKRDNQINYQMDYQQILRTAFGNTLDSRVKTACLDVWATLVSSAPNPLVENLPRLLLLPDSLFTQMIHNFESGGGLFRLFLALARRGPCLIQWLLNSAILPTILEKTADLPSSWRIQCCRLFLIIMSSGAENLVMQCLHLSPAFLSLIFDTLSLGDPDLQCQILNTIGDFFSNVQAQGTWEVLMKRFHEAEGRNWLELDELDDTAAEIGRAIAERFFPDEERPPDFC
jgi:hypothetical protein